MSAKNCLFLVVGCKYAYDYVALLCHMGYSLKCIIESVRTPRMKHEPTLLCTSALIIIASCIFKNSIFLTSLKPLNT